jgi:hypothetical protein
MRDNFKTLIKTVALLGVAASAVSCGDVVRDGKSPSFLVIDTLAGQRGGSSSATFGVPLISDVVTVKTSPAPCTTTSPCPTIFNDNGQVVLRLVPKDIGTTAVGASPSTNNEVTITRYHVNYRRSDGRNTPGVDVPYPFDGAVTGTVQIGGSLTLTFEIVRHDAKLEAPLADLANNITILNAIGEVTFYGQDRVGNAISATGTIQIDFANFGDF